MVNSRGGQLSAHKAACESGSPRSTLAVAPNHASSYQTWCRPPSPSSCELRAAANRFLLPEDDPGHGWRLDHPIGKMGIFQAACAAKLA